MLETMFRQGRLLTVLMLMISLLGIVATLKMPVQMIPDLSAQVIEIDTQWPGATPQDVEQEILTEQERHLRNLPGLAYMESIASAGRASIVLEFPPGISLDQTMLDVINALNKVPGYPDNVDQPSVDSSAYSENPFMYFSVTPLPGNPFNLDMDLLKDFLDRQVKPVMERIEGVSVVSVRGGAERQIQIHVQPDKLAQRGLKLSDIRQAIRERNRDISAGDMESGKRRYLLRTQGRFTHINEIGDLIIQYKEGVTTYLKDVAHIQYDHYEKSSVAYVGGERAITLGVQKESGANVIQIRQDMMAAMEQISRDILAPNGLRVEKIGDDVRYVEASIRSVVTNLALGAFLASLVLFVFMRSGRATAYCLLGLPVCTIAAFIGLMLFDRSVNVISLAGITFAIGMTLDNSIVVLESIEQKLRQGLNRLDAAIAGVRDVWSAVIASSATTVLVFTPIVFIELEAGQLYSDIAITVSASIMASMLFALFILPLATVWLGLARPREHRYDQGWTMRVIRSINAGTKRRFLAITLCLAGTLGIAIAYLPAAEYLPEGEEPKAFNIMIAPAGYNLSEMQAIGEEIKLKLDKALEKTLDEPLAEGEIPPIRYYLMQVNTGSMFVLAEPKDHDKLEQMMDNFVDLFRSYPGMRAFSSRGSIISSNQGGTRTVVMNITGADQQVLFNTAENVMRRAEAFFDNPRLDSDPGSLSLDQPLIQITPKWQRLAELGLDTESFGMAVSAFTDGAWVGEFVNKDQKVDMLLFSRNGTEPSIQKLAQLPFYTSDGNILPLSSLADIHEISASDDIRRIDGQRTVSVYLIPPPNTALATAIETVRTELIPNLKADGDIPAGVNISITGAADQLDATQQALFDNFVVAAILIYLLLVVILSHWIYPTLILTTVPLGIAGGVTGLVMANALGQTLPEFGLPGFNQSFDMITMLGFVILLGTVVNNPILIVCQARAHIQQGVQDVKQAVTLAVSQRLKPIMMSTITTVSGLAPLVFIPSAGSELYQGVGIVVMMGILFSVLVTLVFLPCVLISWLQVQQAFNRKKQKAALEAEA